MPNKDVPIRNTLNVLKLEKKADPILDYDMDNINVFLMDAEKTWSKLIFNSVEVKTVDPISKAAYGRIQLRVGPGLSQAVVIHRDYNWRYENKLSIVFDVIKILRV